MSGFHSMARPVKVAIRADAGAFIGMGHFARASAVTEALTLTGDADIIVLTNDEGVEHIPAYFPAGTRVLPLSADESDPEAAMQAMARLNWKPDVIVIDHYGRVPDWETTAANADARLMVLDDLDAATRADIIVRPHGGSKAAQSGILLMGPAYLPLSKQVVALAHSKPRRKSERLRINVCFGGSDPTHETLKAMRAAQWLSNVDFDVVLGPGAKPDPSLFDLAARTTNIALHHAPSKEAMAELLSNAELALGAGGVMLWERLCFGIPSLVVATADNQLPQISSMAAKGAIRYLGPHSDVNEEVLAEAISALVNDEARRAELSSIGKQMVDGLGAKRLAASARALALNWRDVCSADAKALLDWRTHDQNWQHNWEGSQKPELAAHIEWLNGTLSDPNCVLRIFTRGEEPVGVVRFDLSEGGTSAYLSIYLVPSWHGRKIGLPVFFAAEYALRRSHASVQQIVSRIHSDNAASVKLHRDAGFEFAPSIERNDWLHAKKIFT